MSYIDEFNTTAVFSEGGSSSVNTEKMTVKVELYQAQEGKNNDGTLAEFIQIQLKNKAKETISVRQYLKKRDDGSYKNHIYPAFNDQPASLSYEILQRAKTYMGEEKYEAAKAKFGGVTRSFFETLYFDIEVKRVKNSEGKEFLIPMFDGQIKKDAARAEAFIQKPKTETTEVDSDLPF